MNAKKAILLTVVWLVWLSGIWLLFYAAGRWDSSISDVPELPTLGQLPTLGHWFSIPYYVTLATWVVGGVVIFITLCTDYHPKVR